MTAAKEFATAMPRSLWQCVDQTTLSELLTRAINCCIRSPQRAGIEYPTVSGTLIVLAPASMTASNTCTKKSMSERTASSAENSTSSVYSNAHFTACTARANTCSGVMRNLFSMWMGDVAIKV